MSGRLMLLCNVIRARLAAGEDLEAVLASYLLDDTEAALIRAEVANG